MMENKVNLKLSKFKDIKIIGIVLAENITEILYSYENQNPRKYSKDIQMKEFQQTLNSMNASLLS